MRQQASSRVEAFRRYGLVALAFLHIGVGRGLHGTFGVFFVAMLDAHETNIRRCNRLIDPAKPDDGPAP